ncbi:alpha/beta fold hydrolase [Sediminibacterium roseum]|uniref:Alpha/beta fold hydrolase n=1 Tax=Sediminibacterium roseum TaxID=1978412 RepID=A0ABW9ZYY6_9BACT|nr:alpha/beta fold hydrolase [Sediminibacterium roseum]NCI51765.1 alpha/beta fold hydrolase [Sediminibacterium roseum]
MRILRRFLTVVVALMIIYLLGPQPSSPDYRTELPVVPAIDAGLEQFILQQESAHKLKPDNEARIVWANDSLKQKTEYAIVYLHGFSASQEEGNPVHRRIAAQFGCNLYLSRLSEHGIDTTDALINMTAESLWESAKQAYAIAKQLGNKVIVMGTSTGGTLALQLAAAYPEIAGLVLYSPNIAINDPNAWILNNPWGLQIARLVKGSDFNTAKNNTDIYKQYWNKQYRLEATVQLEELLETSMNNATFGAVKQPTLLLYYYKDEKHQDDVVKVGPMKDMMASLGTPENQERMVAIPEAGSHVIASPIQSKDIVSVEKETADFLKTILHLKEVSVPKEL